MKNLRSLVLASIVVACAACGAGAQAVVQDVGAAALCVDQAVATAVAQGQTTFEDIAVAVVQAGCGPISVAAVEAIINLLRGQTSASSPMGLKLAKITHKVGG